MNALNTQAQDIRQTADLVRAAQAGDRQAFGELFDRFEPTIYRVAMSRLRNDAEAQELSQDVFVQAMQKINQLRTPECFIGWLRQITVNMSKNRIARRKPSVAVEPEILEATVTVSDSPLDFALAVERQDQVRDALTRLGDMDRDTLVAFYVRDMSLLEMADEFGAPLGTIKRRLHVARKRLAKIVEELSE